MCTHKMKSCRVCMENGEGKSKMIAPCKCKGSIQWIHRHCLDTWRCETEESEKTCPNCQMDYLLDSNLSTTMVISFTIAIPTCFLFILIDWIGKFVCGQVPFSPFYGYTHPFIFALSGILTVIFSVGFIVCLLNGMSVCLFQLVKEELYPSTRHLPPSWVYMQTGLIHLLMTFIFGVGLCVILYLVHRELNAHQKMLMVKFFPVQDLS